MCRRLRRVDLESRRPPPPVPVSPCARNARAMFVRSCAGTVPGQGARALTSRGGSPRISTGRCCCRSAAAISLSSFMPGRLRRARKRLGSISFPGTEPGDTGIVAHLPALRCWSLAYPYLGVRPGSPPAKANHHTVTAPGLRPYHVARWSAFSCPSLGQVLSVRIAIGSAYQEDTTCLSMVALVQLHTLSLCTTTTIFH